MNIGDRIKKRREELGLSQEELAKKVGYKSRSSVNKIEIDGRGLPQNKIVIFAKALETTPAYLMGWENEEEMKWAEKAYMATASTVIEDLYAAFEDKEVNHFKDYVKLTDNHKNMVDNYTKKLLSIQDMEHEAELNAAHARTDIDIPENTDTSDNDIMDDNTEWE